MIIRLLPTYIYLFMDAQNIVPNLEKVTALKFVDPVKFINHKQIFLAE